MNRYKGKERTGSYAGEMGHALDSLKFRFAGNRIDEFRPSNGTPSHSAIEEALLSRSPRLSVRSELIAEGEGPGEARRLVLHNFVLTVFNED